MRIREREREILQTNQQITVAVRTPVEVEAQPRWLSHCTGLCYICFFLSFFHCLVLFGWDCDQRNGVVFHYFLFYHFGENIKERAPQWPTVACRPSTCCCSSPQKALLRTFHFVFQGFYWIISPYLSSRELLSHHSSSSYNSSSCPVLSSSLVYSNSPLKKQAHTTISGQKAQIVV